MNPSATSVLRMFHFTWPALPIMGATMALITCPKCGKEISEHVDACPSCEYLIKKSRYSNGSSDETAVTLEAIGKKWKVVQFLGKTCLVIWVILFSVLLYIQPQNSPMLFDISIWVFFAGFILYVVGRIGSW